MKVLYTAAHGGFAAEHAPLGGGAAIFEMLSAEWAKSKPFELEFFTPQSNNGHDITNFDTGSYARFSRQFEAASTEAIRRHDPDTTVILVNDIAEGPNFKAIQDYKIATIWHVDVVAYIAAIYCRQFVAPETLVKLHRRLGNAYPDVLKLIFQKQSDCVQYSAAHIVPSVTMKEIILRCFPDTPPEKIHVLPWGAPPTLPRIDKQTARQQLGIPSDALVLVTLSRLSPEKNQQLMLDALAIWERQPNYPKIYAIICGSAAYMHGKKHESLLRAKAAKLTKTKVVFPGHVHGAQKQRYFSAADLYIFPSSHESYGLTLMEAFQYGLPALTLDNAAMLPAFGAIATQATFLTKLKWLTQSDLAAKGQAAQAYARQNPFANAAARLATILKDASSPPAPARPAAPRP
ncbi:MAG: glycosyltransferase family 4 protein, partial [Saprospiraceae bacterium]